MADYLTYANIKSQVQALIDDSDTAIASIIDSVINNVYLGDIIGEFRKGRSVPPWMVAYDASLDTTAATRTTLVNTLGVNIERIISVSVDNQPCLPITPEELELHTKAGFGNPSPSFWWDTGSTMRPTRYRHRKQYTLATGGETDTFEWFPIPDTAYDIRYWYEKRVSVLSGTTVPDLPTWAHRTIIYGTLIQLAMFDVKVKAGPWAVLYEQGLEQLRGYSNNFVLGGHVEPFGI